MPWGKRTEKAAENGYAPAQFNLGSIYSNGQGTKQDYIKAKKWYEKAAYNGNIPAQYNLGLMYVKGQGVKQNFEIAKHWFVKACGGGLKEGCQSYKELNQ